MQMFAQYLRPGDVVSSARGRFVILGVRGVRTENKREVTDVDAVMIDGPQHYTRVKFSILLDQSYTVLSPVSDERINRMKQPPPE